MVEPDPKKIMKEAAGRAAAERVRSGTVVGLGSGSTAVQAIRCLAKRLRSGELEDIRGVPTSFQSSLLARQLGIPLATVDDVDRIDLAFDGADEVDPHLNLIKGGGGAHTREKIIDSLAETFIVVVDDSKLVDRLGAAFPVPIEILPLAIRPALKAIEGLGGRPEIRMAFKKSGPVITDQGNLLVDAHFGPIEDPAELEKILNNIPGVVDNGLFVGLADLALVGEIVGGQPRVREYRGGKP